MPYWMPSRKTDWSTTDFYRKNENSRDGRMAMASSATHGNANHNTIA